MAKSVNKVILVGRLGRDPELKYTASGVPFCRFSMATDDVWNDKGSGERQERTERHSIVAWDRLAEICNQYLTKGRLVYIEGSLQDLTILLICSRWWGRANRVGRRPERFARLSPSGAGPLLHPPCGDSAGTLKPELPIMSIFTETSFSLHVAVNTGAVNSSHGRRESGHFSESKTVVVACCPDCGGRIR